jgi:putative peptidoglycan binding protein/L,D-transpeptidase-like protein
VPLPKVTPRRLPAPEPAVKTTQQRLIELGYLLRGNDDGRFGPATQNAVLAFQKWEGLGRTGLLNAATKSRLLTAQHPTPVSRGGSGKRAEVLLDRQVALLINNNIVVRAIAVSTGKPSTPTPPRDYRVYAKITRWWSTPFREWLPWALPFNGGIAFHELADVPVPGLARLCAAALHRRQVDVCVRLRRHAGEGDRKEHVVITFRYFVNWCCVRLAFRLWSTPK